MENNDSRAVTTKVAKFRILKPVGALTWNELGKLLRDARYRVYRLANLAVSEAYLNFHMSWSGRQTEFENETYCKLSRRLREMLAKESPADDPDRFSKTGALPDTVAGALSQYKIRALTTGSKWKQVTRGEASLPTFRLGMPIPISCYKYNQRRLEKTDSGDVVVELMICAKPYPRVLLQIGSIGEGQAAVLKRLLDNKEQSKDGYRQRLFEVKQEKLSSKWHIFVTYDLPAPKRSAPDKNIVVGVDLGFRVPLYVALNNGEARLGWRNFAALGEQIKALQNQLDARRRSIQRAGRSDLSSDTAGAGHGRARKLQPTEKLEGKIHKAYTTLNHQLSRSVVEFAVDHGSGVIQMENLEGLQDQLRGKFIGARWRYHQLQQFIEYKAKEAGIDARKVNPRYTSRRCSKCGFINKEFSADFRHSHATPGFRAKFVCPNPDCKFEADPDYNAARNIATIDIEKQIVQQCKRQGISLGDEIIDNPNRAAQQAPLA